MVLEAGACARLDNLSRLHIRLYGHAHDFAKFKLKQGDQDTKSKTLVDAKPDLFLQQRNLLYNYVRTLRDVVRTLTSHT